MIFDQELSAEDTWRANRVQLALKLGKFPHEVDAMPYTDYIDMIDILEFNQTMDKRRAHGMK